MFNDLRYLFVWFWNRHRPLPPAFLSALATIKAIRRSTVYAFIARPRRTEFDKSKVHIAVTPSYFPIQLHDRSPTSQPYMVLFPRYQGAMFPSAMSFNHLLLVREFPL